LLTMSKVESAMPTMLLGRCTYCDCCSPYRSEVGRAVLERTISS
jgi:hypothetical protein